MFKNCISLLIIPNENSLTKNMDNQTKDEKNIQKTEELSSNSQEKINYYLDKSQNLNRITVVFDLELKDINIDFSLFNVETDCEINVYLDNKKVHLIRENQIFKYNIQKEGKYTFEIVFPEDLDTSNIQYFFNECSKIVSIDFSNFNSSNITNMEGMFKLCKKLKEIIGLEKFNTKNVVNMAGLFYECNELKYLDLSNFDTSNVKYMDLMFNGCCKLKNIIGLNNFITNNVELMTGMFQSCFVIENLDLSNFNTSKVTNMESMFNGCHKLKSIKGLNNFNTKNVKNMTGMFQNCFKLEKLNLSNFDTSNVEKIQVMFKLSCIKRNKRHKSIYY